MRRTNLLLALLLLGVSLPAQAQAPLRIGYINSQEILDLAPGTSEASAEFDREMEQLRAQLQPAADSLEQMISLYEAQQLTLSPTARQQREQAIVQHQETLQQRAADLDQQANQRRAELVQPIMDQISQVIEALRVEGSYHLIFDVAAGSIIAADPSLDLTGEIVRRLQAAAGGGG